MAIQAAINAAFNTAPNNNFNQGLNNHGILYFPVGGYKITSALNFTAVVGVIITGAGKSSVQIIQATSGAKVFNINGMAFSLIENLCVTCSGAGSIGMDLGFDGIVGINTENVVIRNCFFNGCDIGIRIGHTQQSSENSIEYCWFQGCTTAGIKTVNPNALSNYVHGGDFQQCAIGIWVEFGSVPVIAGVGFQLTTGFDIQIDNSSDDTYLISGCRSESDNFLKASQGAVVVAGCSHQTTTGGAVFAQSGSHQLTLMNSISGHNSGFGGKLDNSGDNSFLAFTVINCEFGQPIGTACPVGARIFNSWFNGTVNAGTGTFYEDVLTNNGVIQRGIGYRNGLGGAQSQGTSKSTTVVLNAVSGQITTFNDALNANTTVSFTLTNNRISANDILVMNHISGGTPGSYALNARAVSAGSATIDIRNVTAGNLSEAIVIAFSLFKSANS